MPWPMIRSGPSTPIRVEPFDRRLAVATDHLVELDDRLAGMRLHRDAALLASCSASLKKSSLAGVDLRRAAMRRRGRSDA